MLEVRLQMKLICFILRSVAFSFITLCIVFFYSIAKILKRSCLAFIWTYNMASYGVWMYPQRSIFCFLSRNMESKYSNSGHKVIAQRCLATKWMNDFPSSISIQSIGIHRFPLTVCRLSQVVFFCLSNCHKCPPKFFSMTKTSIVSKSTF